MTDLVERIATALADRDRSARPIDVLATALAVPPYVTWQHLRRVRRQLFGPGSLGLEFDLAESELVESATQGGFALHSEDLRQRRELLRELFSEGASDEDRLALIPPATTLSPLLEVEAELVHAYVTRTEFLETSESILRDVLLTLTQESRSGIRDWAAGALHRLPTAIAATSAGYLLGRICGELIPVPAAERQPIDEEFARDIAGFLPTRLVAIYRDGIVTNLGAPSRSRAHAINIPSLPGVPIRVSWRTDAAPESRLVDLAVLPVVLETGRSQVVIEDIAGSTYVLDAFDDDVSPEAHTLDLDLDTLESARASDTPVRVTPLRPSRSGLVVRFDDAPSLTGHISGFALDQCPQWWTSRTKEMQVTHFDRKTRVVLGKPVLAERALPSSLVARGDVVDGTIVRMSGFGAFIEVLDGLTGLLHDTEIAAGTDLSIGTSILVEVVDVDDERDRVAFATVPRRPIDVAPRNDAFRSAEEQTAWRRAAVAAFPRGTPTRGRVSKVVNFGVFVTITTSAGQLDALLHNSEIPARDDPVPGDELDVVVIRAEDDRLSVGMNPRVKEGEPTRQTVLTKPAPTASIEADASSGPHPPPPDGASVDVAQAVHAVLRASSVDLALSDVSRRVSSRIGSTTLTAAKRPFGGLRSLLHACGVETYTTDVGIHVARRPAPDAPVPTVMTQIISPPEVSGLRRHIETASTVDEMADAVHELLSKVSEPVDLANLGHQLGIIAAPELWGDRWFDHANLTAFVRHVCPGVVIARRDNGQVVVYPYRPDGD